MTIASTTTMAGSNRKWRPPPSEYLDVHCPPLAEGRRLMKESHFPQAADSFRTALVELEEQPLPHPSTGDAWTPDEIVISTRLFLLKAVWAAAAPMAALVEAHALMELVVVATTSHPAPALELVLMACQTVARLLKEEHQPENGTNQDVSKTTKPTATTTAETILEMGIVACSASLELDGSTSAKHTFSSPKQRRQFWELQSQFYEQLGNLEGAATALEGLVRELVATQGNTLADQCPHRKRLREYHIQLGKINVEEERAEALQQQSLHQAKQSHKKRNRQRHRDVLSNRLGEQLTILQPQVETICQLGSDDKLGSDSGSFFEGLEQTDSSTNRPVADVPGPPPGESDACQPVTTSIDWDSIPSQLAPGSSAGGGIRHHKDKRVRRKQRQLEALYSILKRLIARYEKQKMNTGSSLDRPIHIVDFGAGSGNSCLVFAWLLRDRNCRFTLVDNKSHAVLLGQQRTQQAGLSTDVVTWVCGDVADYNDAFDIGLATHLCGGGTDLAMANCLRHQAAFLVTPCCLGKLKFYVNNTSGDAGILEDNESNNCKDSLVYPRSAWLRDHLSPDEYLEMTRLGDNTGAMAETEKEQDGKADKTWQLRLKGKALLDADRLELARENGYETELGRLGSKSDCGPKSDVLCGVCMAA